MLVLPEQIQTSKQPNRNRDDADNRECDVDADDTEQEDCFCERGHAVVSSHTETRMKYPVKKPPFESVRELER